LGATSLGRDLAGAVATSLETSLTVDCTELKIDGLIYTKEKGSLSLKGGATSLE